MKLSHFLLAGLIVSTGGVAFGQTNLVVPNGYAGTDGPSATAVPMQSAARTYQMQIAASQLTAIASGSSLNALHWRLDQGSVSFPTANVTWADYEITLAQATNSIGSFSSNFASNMTNPVLVRSGSLSFTTGAYPNTGSPPNFGPFIAFSTPYIYQGGDLVLYLTHTGSNAAGVGSLDAVDTSDGNYGSAFVAQFSTGYQAANASATDFQAVVTEFSFTSAAVPEPTTWALIGISIAGAGYGGYRLRRSKCKTMEMIVEPVEV